MNTMDVREKLLEILAPTSLNFEQATYLADYLVKNGVTVQEWIPVNERLPEKQVDAVALSNKNGGYMFVGYRGYISGEWMENGALHIGDVSHWMPLPPPPKGE